MDECGAGCWCSVSFTDAGRMGSLDVGVGERGLQS